MADPAPARSPGWRGQATTLSRPPAEHRIGSAPGRALVVSHGPHTIMAAAVTPHGSGSAARHPWRVGGPAVRRRGQAARRRWSGGAGDTTVFAGTRQYRLAGGAGGCCSSRLASTVTGGTGRGALFGAAAAAVFGLGDADATSSSPMPASYAIAAALAIRWSSQRGGEYQLHRVASRPAPARWRVGGRNHQRRRQPTATLS